MALGTATVVANAQGGQSASAPLRLVTLTFQGDGAYPAGGTPAFEAYVRAALSEDVTLLCLVDQSIGANRAIYDAANDKLWIDVKATGVEHAVAADTEQYQVMVLCK